MFAVPALALNWSVFQALGVVPELSRCYALYIHVNMRKINFMILGVKLHCFFFYVAIKVFHKDRCQKMHFYFLIACYSAC